MTTAMKELTFWFDPVSPFAYLAFERLPQALEGLSVDVTYRPMLFAALLKHWDQKGPAEIEPKRAWDLPSRALGSRIGRARRWPRRCSIRSTRWPCCACCSRARLPAARRTASPARTVLHHVWQGGADANDADRLAALTRELAPRIAPDDPQIKHALRDATDAAIAQGLFGVPTIEVDGRLFWGLDALPMLADYLRGDPWFATDTWAREGRARGGVTRKS